MSSSHVTPADLICHETSGFGSAFWNAGALGSGAALEASINSGFNSGFGNAGALGSRTALEAAITSDYSSGFGFGNAGALGLRTELGALLGSAHAAAAAPCFFWYAIALTKSRRGITNSHCNSIAGPTLGASTSLEAPWMCNGTVTLAMAVAARYVLGDESELSLEPKWPRMP